MQYHNLEGSWRLSAAVNDLFDHFYRLCSFAVFEGFVFEIFQNCKLQSVSLGRIFNSNITYIAAAASILSSKSNLLSDKMLAL